MKVLLGVSLKQTRIYKEAKAEGREEGREERKTEMLIAVVPLLVKTGMSAEQIAQQFDVDVEAVQFAAQQST